MLAQNSIKNLDFFSFFFEHSVFTKIRKRMISSLALSVVNMGKIV